MRKKHYKKVYSRESDPLWKKIVSYSFLVLIGGIILCLLIFIYYAKDLPRPERFTERPFSEPTRIYDRTGEVLFFTIFGEERRDIVSLDKIPEHLIQAVIATEDANFYNHFGLDIRGITRAVIENIKAGRVAQGGSTISQQLIRSTFLTGERTIGRKVREAILTIELERRYTKDEILGFYLNQIPFGQNAYGVEAASQIFFNKSVSEISIAESAILASLIKSPSGLSPYGPNREYLMIRKDHVLDRMATVGFITQKEADELKKEVIEFSPINHLLKAPHFTLDVVAYLNRKYGEDRLRTRGLKIYTTIDWELQQEAERIIKEVSKTNKHLNSFNSSLVALDPSTGEILAMVGSVDYFKKSLPEGCIPGKTCLFDPYPNMTTRLRQPGSAFKPFIYADAFKNGYTDQTIVMDKPIQIGNWAPRNYDGQFRGAVTLREALAQSLNIPSIKVLSELSNIDSSIETTASLGITTLNQPASHYGLPLALGVGEVTLLEMTSAYGTFATGGFIIPPSSIFKITDSRGRIIEKNNPSPKRVLNFNVAKMISDILSDNEARSPVFGSNSQLNIPGVSVKTGTTQDYRDGWAIGYNPSLVVGVWSGNNNNTSMRNGPGLVVASPIWREFFDYALTRY